jgi:hypothetical protein
LVPDYDANSPAWAKAGLIPLRDSIDAAHIEWQRFEYVLASIKQRKSNEI